MPEPRPSSRSRISALFNMGAAYARHQVRRRLLRRRPAGLEQLLAQYAGDGLVPLTAAERELLPAMSRCIGCGICALVAGRLGTVNPADLATAYLRPLPALSKAAPDLEGQHQADLEAAAAACPVGVPLPAVALLVRRLAEA